jgi:hypothetical protein
VLGFGIVTEIDEKSDPCSGRPEIVHELGAVAVLYGLGGFDFKDDLAIAEKVRLISLSKFSAFVFQFQRRFDDEGHRSDLKLDLQTLLIDILQKATSLLTIDFKTGA